MCEYECLSGILKQISPNPFKPNGISHFYQLDKSISYLKVVG